MLLIRPSNVRSVKGRLVGQRTSPNARTLPRTTQGARIPSGSLPAPTPSRGAGHRSVDLLGGGSHGAFKQQRDTALHRTLRMDSPTGKDARRGAPFWLPCGSFLGMLVVASEEVPAGAHCVRCVGGVFLASPSDPLGSRESVWIQFWGGLSCVRVPLKMQGRSLCEPATITLPPPPPPGERRNVTGELHDLVSRRGPSLTCGELHEGQRPMAEETV